MSTRDGTIRGCCTHLGIGYKGESRSLLDHLRDGQRQILGHKAEDGENCEAGKHGRQDIRYCHHNGVRVKVIAELQWTKLDKVRMRLTEGVKTLGQRKAGPRSHHRDRVQRQTLRSNYCESDGCNICFMAVIPECDYCVHFNDTVAQPGRV